MPSNDLLRSLDPDSADVREILQGLFWQTHDDMRRAYADMQENEQFSATKETITRSQEYAGLKISMSIAVEPMEGNDAQ